MQSCFHKIRRTQNQHRSGWTLLELILSLALSVFVIMLINSAMQLYYYSLAKVQSSTEQDQLARALLRRITDDLRATVRYEKFDDSGFMTLPTSPSSALSGASSSTSSSTSSSSTSSTTPSTTTPMTSSTGGSSTTGQTGSTSGTGDTSGGTTESSETESTTDPAAVREIPGIYGTKTSLQIDVCRIPRPEEYAGIGTNGQGGKGDVHSTSYFVNTSSSDQNSNGLIRMERSRASALFATQNGADESAQGIVLAPEVIYAEFLYYDPILATWAEEWDSTVQNNVPKAVKIILVIDKPKTSSAQNKDSLVGMSLDEVRDKHPEAVFQTVINIPSWSVAKTEPDTSSESGTDTGTGSSTTGTSGTSTSGSGGTSK